MERNSNVYELTVYVNDRPVTDEVRAEKTLLDFLREHGEPDAARQLVRRDGNTWLAPSDTKE